MKPIIIAILVGLALTALFFVRKVNAQDMNTPMHIKFAWSYAEEEAAKIDGFRIYKKANFEDEWEQVSTVLFPNTTYTSQQITAGYYSITAYNSVSESPKSEPAFVPHAPGLAPVIRFK